MSRPRRGENQRCCSRCMRSSLFRSNVGTTAGATILSLHDAACKRLCCNSLRCHGDISVVFGRSTVEKISLAIAIDHARIRAVLALSYPFGGLMEYTRTTVGAGLRDFLEIPYDQLEEMNLEAKEAAARPRRPPTRSAKSGCKYLDRREAHQGGHRVLHRPRRPAAHARLRQEVPAQVGRQPDVRRLVDPRLLAAARSPTCAWRSTGRPSTGCRRTSSAPARCWSSARCSSATARPYRADMRARLKAYTDEAVRQGRHGLPTPPTRSRASSSRAATPSAATTRPAASSSSRTGGYYHSLPGDPLRAFIDTAAEVQRAMGFANEKDHPEVAPSQFEMNYSLHRGARSPPTRCSSTSCSAGRSRARMDMTASFLPKPVTGVNGNGMHTNLSLDAEGQEPVLRRRRARTGSRQVGLGLHRPHPDQRPRTSAWCSTRASTPTAGSTRTSRRRTRSRPRPSTAARWCASRSATSARRASRSARSLRTPTRTWRSTPLLAHRARRPADARSDGDEAQPHALPAGQHLRRDPAVQGRASSCAELLGEEVHDQVRRAEARSGRALPEGAGHARSRPPRCSSTTR